MYCLLVVMSNLTDFILGISIKIFELCAAAAVGQDGCRKRFFTNRCSREMQETH